jgi:hypothetical protein
VVVGGTTGPAAAPWLFLMLFIAASFLMIWRLESMTENGMEGRFLGTRIMPYRPGMGNLIFALVVRVPGASFLGAEGVARQLQKIVLDKKGLLSSAELG